MRLPSWARAVPLVLVATAVLAAGCGRSGYQYVEDDDESVFIKIPDDWDVVSKGNVDFAITLDEIPSVFPGERILPWRARFSSAPADSQDSRDHLVGFVEIQPVDRRMRSSFDPLIFFPVHPTVEVEGVEVVSHHLVTSGDVSGHRIIWKQLTADGDEIVGDRLVLTDTLNSEVYVVGFACTVVCYNANARQIDEVMRTFTVED